MNYEVDIYEAGYDSLFIMYLKMLWKIYIYEAGYDSLFIMYLKILWKMEHLLQKSKCSIFPNIFKSIQNLTYLFLEFFNVV